MFESWKRRGDDQDEHFSAEVNYYISNNHYCPAVRDFFSLKAKKAPLVGNKIARLNEYTIDNRQRKK